jgi:1-acyl-sn-glycerol-3-phosphate acyltransferase
MTRGILAWCVRILTGVRLVRELPCPPGPHIYYANHSSHLDFVVIWAALPAALRERTRPVAAADYWERGPLRSWLAKRVFHAVLIPRGQVRREDDPIGRMTAALDEGSDLILFPEGTRSADGSVAEFRSGLHVLAHRYPQAALVPVYLENLNRILPKGEFLVVPLMGNAIFGPPCDGLREGEPRREFLTRTREALLELSRHPHDTAPNPSTPTDEP